MRSKLILTAAILPLFFGGTSNVLAATQGSCSGDSGGVTCSSLTLSTAADAASLLKQGYDYSDFYTTNLSTIKTFAQVYYDTHANIPEALRVGWNAITAIRTLFVDDPSVFSTPSYTGAEINVGFKNGLATIYANTTGLAHINFTINGQNSALESLARGPEVALNTFNVAAVPGPEAGTGLVGLAMAAVGFWVYRRKAAASAV